MEVPDILIKDCSEDEHSRKCPRCWKWHDIIENYDDLCDRCQRAILSSYPNHESVPGIMAALEAQRKKYLKEPNVRKDGDKLLEPEGSGRS
jgi:predicted amidophosphoribosyltransferase